VAPLLEFAEKGDPHAQYNVGVRCENGVTLTKDTTIAAEWYEKAAEQGYAFAQLN
jgi:TPR repeat protein